MKVICDRAVLLDAINLTTGVVASRTPKPQLTCVKLIATNDGDSMLTLGATDAEISLRLTTANVQVDEPGEALIPAEKLRQIIAAEDREQTLTLTTKDDELEIKGQDAKFKVYGYPAGDFPKLPAESDTTGKNAFEIPASELSALIARTSFATARENSRYAINGVLLKCDGKNIQMVATDGRRLAIAKTSAGSGASGVEAIGIIPTKALTLVGKLAANPAEGVRVAVTDNQAIFAFGDEATGSSAVLSTTLVEGAFPPYEDVVPKDQDKKATFDRDTLASGVRRAALLTNEESRGVRLAFDGKQLCLTSRAPEMGEAEVKVDMEAYDGDAMEVGFNPVFITDALKVIEDSQVVFELKAGNKPGVLRSGADFLYVVMPVSLT